MRIYANDIFTPDEIYKVFHIKTTSFNRFKNHSHEKFCEIIFLLKGKIRHLYNNERYSHTAGDIIFIKEKDFHAISGNHFEFINIAIRIDYFFEFLGLYNHQELMNLFNYTAKKPYIITEKEKTTKTVNNTNYFPRLYKYCNERQKKAVLFEFLFNILNLFLLNLKLPISRQPPQPPWLSKLLIFIDENLEENLAVAKLHTACGKTKGHLSRSFKKYLGLTPSTYVNNLKLKRGKKYLENTNINITEIAFTLGFSSLNYFIILFKKKYNISPAVYRKKHGNIFLLL